MWFWCMLKMNVCAQTFTVLWNVSKNQNSTTEQYFDNGPWDRSVSPNPPSSAIIQKKHISGRTSCWSWSLPESSGQYLSSPNSLLVFAADLRLSGPPPWTLHRTVHLRSKHMHTNWTQILHNIKRYSDFGSYRLHWCRSYQTPCWQSPRLTSHRDFHWLRGWTSHDTQKWNHIQNWNLHYSHSTPNSGYINLNQFMLN